MERICSRLGREEVVGVATMGTRRPLTDVSRGLAIVDMGESKGDYCIVELEIREGSIGCDFVGSEDDVQHWSLLKEGWVSLHKAEARLQYSLQHSTVSSKWIYKNKFCQP